MTKPPTAPRPILMVKLPMTVAPVPQKFSPERDVFDYEAPEEDLEPEDDDT